MVVLSGRMTLSGLFIPLSVLTNLNTLSELQLVKGLKIIQMNIRSLFPKIDRVRTLLMNSKVDIKILSETCLNASIDSQMVNIPEYSLIRHDRSFGSKSRTKRGGGLSIST